MSIVVDPKPVHLPCGRRPIYPQVGIYNIVSRRKLKLPYRQSFFNVLQNVELVIELLDKKG